MPIPLDMTADALLPQHAPAMLDLLYATMIWPGFGQAEQRREFMRSYAADRMVEQAEAVPGTMRIEMLKEARAAKPSADFKVEHARRCREGTRVGDFYAEALMLSRVGVPVSVKHLTSFKTRPALRRLHPDLGISESQLRDLLREYRPAAHLWAAFVLSSSQNIDGAIPPCAPHRIGEFLAASEWVADRLGEIRLERRNKPLIGPDLWRVPASVVPSLPNIDIHDVGWPEDRPALPHDLFKLHEFLQLAP